MSAPNGSRSPARQQSRPALSLEERALRDAAALDAVASDAVSVAWWVLLRPSAARRIARTLRALAVVSRESL